MSTLYPPRKAVKTVSVAAVRWSIAVVFIISMATSFAVAVQSKGRDDDMRRVVATQQTVLARVQANTHNLCMASNKAAAGSNAILDTLIAAVRVTKSLPPAEKTDRIRKYRAIRVHIGQCR